MDEYVKGLMDDGDDEMTPDEVVAYVLHPDTPPGMYDARTGERIDAEYAVCSCKGRRWVNDENWTPADPRWRGKRSQGDGLIPCGFCNEGGWNVAEWGDD